MPELKQNIIIAFDGPDNVGKSTQIKKFRRYFNKNNFVVLNLEAPVGNRDKGKLDYGIKNIINYLESVREISKKNIPQILDRIHFTEYAYSFLRGGHKIKSILDIERDFIDLKDNFFIITFIDKVENIANRDDGFSAFDPEKKEQIEKIIQNFKEISKKSIFKNIIINISEKDEDVVFCEMLGQLGKIDTIK